MYAELAWVLVSSRTEVQTHIKFHPDYFLDYFSISFEYDKGYCQSFKFIVGMFHANAPETLKCLHFQNIKKAEFVMWYDGNLCLVVSFEPFLEVI